LERRDNTWWGKTEIGIGFEQGQNLLRMPKEQGQYTRNVLHGFLHEVSRGEKRKEKS